MDKTFIIGAGPAGLTAALELSRLGRPAIVLEQDSTVGGLARTVEYKGYRFDIGGHRFFTKAPLVEDIWRELLGADLLEIQRLSRIYYRGRYFDYPLRPLNAVLGLGPFEACRILLSYLRARLAPLPEEPDFESWVINRFGRRLYEIFFKSYTEKVWGMPCHEISSDWAAQRIKNLDLAAALRNAFTRTGAVGDGAIVTTLIDRFLYPRLGPGMMWESCRARLERSGVPTWTGTRVLKLHHSDHHSGRRVTRLTVDRGGELSTLDVDQVLCSMPLQALVGCLDPAPPGAVRAAARQLRYRDFLAVVLIVDRPRVFPDNWLYVHSPEVRVGRIQNFKNWSEAMVPDPSRTSLGLEYFVHEHDELLGKTDQELAALGARELQALGLVDASEVIDSVVVRVPKAYPVYDHRYRDVLSRMLPYLRSFSNLQLMGRNGQHRYNNQDHSMLTGIYAARNLAGANYDIWSVNVDLQHHETATTDPDVGGGNQPRRPHLDRLTPERVASGVTTSY